LSSVYFIAGFSAGEMLSGGILCRRKRSIETLKGENFQEFFSRREDFRLDFKNHWKLKENQIFFQMNFSKEFKRIFQAELSTMTFLGGIFSRDKIFKGKGHLRWEERSKEELSWEGDFS
jgi:predicted acylesterase/phospholipase RssA